MCFLPPRFSSLNGFLTFLIITNRKLVNGSENVDGNISIVIPMEIEMDNFHWYFSTKMLMDYDLSVFTKRKADELNFFKKPLVILLINLHELMWLVII